MLSTDCIRVHLHANGKITLQLPNAPRPAQTSVTLDVRKNGHITCRSQRFRCALHFSVRRGRQKLNQHKFAFRQRRNQAVAKHAHGLRRVEDFTAGENFQLHPLLYTPIPRLPDSLHQLTHGKRLHARFGVRRGDDAPYAVRRSGDVRDEFILPHPGNAFNTQYMDYHVCLIIP